MLVWDRTFKLTSMVIDFLSRQSTINLVEGGPFTPPASRDIYCNRYKGHKRLKSIK
jgi:hypothetical protein